MTVVLKRRAAGAGFPKFATVAFDAIHTSLMSLGSTIGSIVAGYDIGVFCANVIFGVDEKIERIAYVQGYDFMSNYYRTELQNSAEAFLTNKSEATALDFCYKYTMLYLLRVKGEEAYLEMSEATGKIDQLFTDYGYAKKQEFVENQIAYLRTNCIFNPEITSNGNDSDEGTRYQQKSVISCPVDVVVKDSADTIVAELNDGEVADFTNAHGRFAVIYDSYSGEYIKVVCLNDDKDYDIRMIGVGDGTVNCEYAVASQDEVIHCFKDELISDGGQILINAERIVEDGSYEVDSNGDGNFETKHFELMSANDDEMLGDVSGDKIVDGLDITIMIEHFVNGVSLNPEQFKAGDINHDNVVDGLDILMVTENFVNGVPFS